MSIEFLDCLKRERDISIKAMSSGGKMAFRLIPPLIYAIRVLSMQDTAYDNLVYTALITCYVRLPLAVNPSAKSIPE